MYKILNGHTAPNLKEVFLSNKERGNTYNLRNNLALPIFRRKNSARDASIIKKL